VKQELKRGLLCFGVGICLGIAPFAWQNWPVKQVESTLEESVISQRIFNELQYYPKEECRWDVVLRGVEEFSAGTRKPLPMQQAYEILINMGIKCSEQFVQENLKKSNQYIEELREKKGIIESEKGFVYAEILESGSGEDIAENDVILMHFKEYNFNGELIKDTTKDRPYKIPLSQTIRGFKRGLKGAKIGERRKIYVHPDWGFSVTGFKEPNVVLIYEVSILEKITT